MPLSAFDHTEYRPFLRAWIQDHPSRSQTVLARRAGVARSTVAMVLAGERDIPLATAASWADALELDEDARAYFLLLVKADSPISLDLRRQARTQAAAIRDARHAIRPTLEQARWLGRWFVPVLVELARTEGFRADPAWLASRIWPPVPVQELADTLEAMRALGMLVETEAHTRVRALPLATPPQLADELSRIGREYHRVQFEHAARALDEQDASSRFVASVTVGVARADLPALRDALRRFQLEVIEPFRARESAEAVVQVSVQMFGRTV